MSASDAVELVNIRLIARVAANGEAALDSLRLPTKQDNQRDVTANRMAYFGPQLGLLETPLLTRHELRSGLHEGPLIIEEYDATCVVPPGCSVHVDDAGNIDIRVGT
jgi:N-methylhydantoinase A